MKELFDKSAETEDDQESSRANKYKRFVNQVPAYYGDEDEQDGLLLQEEGAEEEQNWKQRLRMAMLEVGCKEEEIDAAVWPMPRGGASDSSSTAAGAKAGEKRSSSDKQSRGRNAKRAKKDATGTSATDGDATGEKDEDEDMEDAQVQSLIKSHLFALPAEQLGAVKVPDRQEIEAFLLDARKRALRSECE